MFVFCISPKYCLCTTLCKLFVLWEGGETVMKCRLCENAFLQRRNGM